MKTRIFPIEHKSRNVARRVLDLRACNIGRWLFLCGMMALLFASFAFAQGMDPARYVDPFIGTGGDGNVFPGATMPFGMVQLSPDERTGIASWPSGYSYSAHTILGFSQTHLSGTGVADYGDILFMPTVGKIRVKPGTTGDPCEGYGSAFSHSTESACPGFYSVFLQRYGVRVDLTATDRCGMQEYSYPRSDSSNVIIDLRHGIGNTCTGGWVRIVGNRWVEGMRRSHGWADLRYVYFVAEFSKPFKSFGTAEGAVITAGSRKAKGDSVKAYVAFDTKKDKAIIVRVGISAVSLEGAKKNLAAEMPDFNFDKYRKEVHDAWNRALSKIRIEGGTRTEKVTFYTALYHTMMAPNIFQDVDGRYFGMDHKIHVARGFTNYTVFSLWDVFRADFPLMSIIDPERYENFIRSMIEEYREDGLLPIWPLWGNETHTMIGYPSVPVIFDGYMRGFRSFDVKTAFAAMKHSADLNWQGLKDYRERGYVPADRQPASVSKTLEYAYEDWCIAQMAKKLGDMADYRKFNYRSLFYQNVFDPAVGFMRGKLSNGSWITPFDPNVVSGQYTEANAWQYSFFVPQDLKGLIELFGGKKKFADKLDTLFGVSSGLAGKYQTRSITGMTGQDAQGNEPSHHMPYLYDYCGQPWKTQHVVREIMSRWYTDKPDGLCGNDDCGQMSAWYVFSAMGFYSVTPGQNTFAIGSPQFKKVTVSLNDGKKFIIEAENASDKNEYIQSASLDGQPYDHAYLTQSELEAGGTLRFVMSDKPDSNWGVDNPGLFAMAPDHNVIPVVGVHTTGVRFSDSTTVNLDCALGGSRIRFTLDGATPGQKSRLYTKQFVIRKTRVLEAAAYSNNERSMTTIVRFVKAPYPPFVAAYKYSYTNQYTGGGPTALTDGRLGTTNYEGSAWQGFRGTDLDVTIDLKRERKIGQISTGFLQNADIGIFVPEYVKYYVSQDGKHFREIAEVKNSVKTRSMSPFIKRFAANLKGAKARYLRVFAKNRDIIPSWCWKSGAVAWLFVDEISLIK